MGAQIFLLLRKRGVDAKLYTKETPRYKGSTKNDKKISPNSISLVLCSKIFIDKNLLGTQYLSVIF
jgi:hypothetical protein